MRNKDLKKGRESIIGKIIYGFLLFMPLIAIGVTCGYAMFNKNAKDSFEYGNETQLKTLDTTTNKKGNTFYVSYDENGNTYNYSMQFIYSWISTNPQDLVDITLDYIPNGIQFYDGGAIRLHNPNTDTWVSYVNSWGVKFFNISFIIDITPNNIFFGGNTNVQVIYLTQQPISNVFYYAVDKVEQSNLFNWSKTTIIYTGILNTCTQLGITNTFTPMLLAYWLIISVIYILYDIILMILIILHNKVHQLQDSMN